MMGVGKSSTGKKLANRLGWDFIDLDHAVERITGKSVAEIFQNDGEEQFRRLERQALLTAIVSTQAVIAVGGGTPCFYDQHELMLEEGLCIWLDAPVGMLAQRVLSSKSVRPLLLETSRDELEKKLEDILEQRQAFYAKAHVIMTVNHLTAPQIIHIVEEIIRGREQALA
jgi:shikimate kinase